MDSRPLEDLRYDWNDWINNNLMVCLCQCKKNVIISWLLLWMNYYLTWILLYFPYFFFSQIFFYRFNGMFFTCPKYIWSLKQRQFISLEMCFIVQAVTSFPDFNWNEERHQITHSSRFFTRFLRFIVVNILGACSSNESWLPTYKVVSNAPMKS